MKGKPATVRNQESRARKRDRGMVRTEVTVHADDRDALHEFAAILNAKRQIHQQDQTN